MREGLLDLRFGLRALAKFPLNSYVIISRMHHYTVHESCFDAICIVRIRLLAIVIIGVFASTLYNCGLNDDGMDYG